jgi:hypothetical protein
VIAGVEPPDAPGKVCLLRRDGEQGDTFIWCGRALGWLPFDAIGRLHRVDFTTEEAAFAAAQQFGKWPLQE